MKITCLPSQVVNDSPFIVIVSYTVQDNVSTICIEGVDESDHMAIQTCKIVESNQTCSKFHSQISNEQKDAIIKWRIYSNISGAAVDGDTNGFEYSTVGNHFLYNYPCQHCIF
jgi:hypothetical protein